MSLWICTKCKEIGNDPMVCLSCSSLDVERVESAIVEKEGKLYVKVSRDTQYKIKGIANIQSESKNEKNT